MKGHLLLFFENTFSLCVTVFKCLIFRINKLIYSSGGVKKDYYINIISVFPEWLDLRASVVFTMLSSEN